KAFLQDWLARSTELVEKFHPDLIYFDWWINQPAFAPYLKKMAAYYYNAAAARHQGVVLTYKLHAIPRGAAVQEVAFGKRHYLSLRPWQADISVSRDS
ncbi:alpha-L-fucosidase, partial [mine drainage metagenome]